tara:strand:- start:20042 stop:20710 length:669 start_codon:yes stop_codon:yes gene_type:complete
MGFSTSEILQQWGNEKERVDKRVNTFSKLFTDKYGKSVKEALDKIEIGKTGEEYMGFNPTEQEVDEFNWNKTIEQANSLREKVAEAKLQCKVNELNLNNNMKVPREFGEDKQSQEDSYAGTGVYLDIDNDYTTPSGSAKRASTIVGGVYDAGLHYRKKYKGINLDPFRIAQIYNLDGIQLTILKKTLVTGERGSKDILQDYKDIINAATRAIEMIEEDNCGG